jgi:fucose permease
MKSSSKLIIWGNYFGFVVMGMIVVSFGSTMPYIREELSLSFEKGGMILAFFSGSYLLNGMLSGWLVDQIGKKAVLVTGNGLYVLGLSLLFFASQVWMIYISVIILGIGWGFCNTTINILVNDSSHGDAKAMSLLHMSFGVGAFFVPLLFNILLKMGFAWKELMLLLAVLASVSSLLSIGMKIEFIKEDKKKDSKNSFQNPNQLVLYMAVLFFYVGSESAFSGWIVSYLITGLEMGQSFAQNMLSTLWLTIIIGRYVIGLMGMRIKKAKFVMTASGTAFLSMVLFISTSNQLLILLSVIGIGLSFAGIYPLTMAHANPIIRGSGLATALVISGGGLGSTIVPYISGRIADRYGTVAIIATILVTLICMFLFSLINERKNAQKV